MGVPGLFRQDHPVAVHDADGAVQYSKPVNSSTRHRVVEGEGLVDELCEIILRTIGGNPAQSSAS